MATCSTALVWQPWLPFVIFADQRPHWKETKLQSYVFPFTLIAFLFNISHWLRVQHSYEERVPVPLALAHSPYCLTYAFFPSAAVLDPTLLEEQIAEGTLSLTLNAQGEICIFSKVGGSPMAVDELMRCVKVASVRVKDFEQIVKRELEKDASRRKLKEGDGGKGADLDFVRR